MSHPRFRVTRAVHHPKRRVYTVTLTSIPDERKVPADNLVRTLPEEEGKYYEEGREYFVEVWPVPVGERS